jgi:biopolymer transport protein TolQ
MLDTYSVSLKSKSIFAIISEADVVVQAVVLMLLLASIWSWTIILNKMFRLRFIKKRNKKFFKLFDSKSSFGDIVESIKGNVVSPIEYIFISTINDIKHYKPEETGQLSVERRADMKSRLKTTMVYSKNKHMNKLENDLGYLATIASVSPFIGLFGTVWGIMQSFQAIAFSKNTSLAVVAPGIAEALFATALGLVAAIPALMFYNILLGKVTALESETDDFLVKFNNKIEIVLKL